MFGEIVFKAFPRVRSIAFENSFPSSDDAAVDRRRVGGETALLFTVFRVAISFDVLDGVGRRAPDSSGHVLHSCFGSGIGSLRLRLSELFGFLVPSSCDRSGLVSKLQQLRTGHNRGQVYEVEFFEDALTAVGRIILLP